MKIIKLQSCDGDLFEVDDDVVSMCATVRNMLRGKSAFRNSLGGQFSIDGSYVILKKEGRVLASLIKNNDEEAIVSLPDVKSSTLQKVIEYCKFHNSNSYSDREKRAWDSEFVQVKQSVLCELASASYYLDIKSLVNLTSKAIATQISGKTSEEIRETFCNINYEGYAPLFASSLATRCRLQRKFNKKKQEKDQKVIEAGQVYEADHRSLEELLEFIGEIKEPTKSPPQPPKKKKKNKKKKKKQNDRPPESNTPQPEKNDLKTTKSGDDEEEEEEGSEGSKDNVDLDVQWADEGFDDDLDPEMRAALDKEVEEFRQRLESINSESRSIPKIPLPVSPGSFVSSLSVGVH